MTGIPAEASAESSELTSKSEVVPVMTDVSSWFDDKFRCSPAFRYPTIGEVKASVDDPDQVLFQVQDTDNPDLTVGLAICSKSTNQVLWLLADPANYGAIATALCSAAKATGLACWGVVESDVVRDLFLDTGNFEIDLTRTYKKDGAIRSGAIAYVGE